MAKKRPENVLALIAAARAAKAAAKKRTAAKKPRPWGLAPEKGK